MKSRLFLTILLAFISFFLYFLPYTAMFFCEGPDGGSFEIKSCSIPGISGLAETGYAIVYLSSFMLAIPIATPVIVVWLMKRYWLKTRKNELSQAKLVSSSTKIGLTLSYFSLFVLVVIPAMLLYIKTL